jgi:predicted DNA-binding transcriptional regulator YafY
VDRTERFFKIVRMLRQKKLISLRQIKEELEYSRSTFKRDLEYMRDRLNIPIEWDRELGGYRLEAGADNAPLEFPGFWLSDAEVQALLATEHLIESMDSGVLAESLAPIKQRLEKLLAQSGASVKQVRRRVKLLKVATRTASAPHFSAIASALFARKQLQLTYFVRERKERTERAVSPQRLVHYRDNWYLDGWCHLRDGLRSFSLDAIEAARELPAKAKDVDDEELDRVLASGYGIFSGAETQKARLRFSTLRSRWVAREQWHPRQVGSFDDEGRCVLELPYSDPRELLGAVLRYGPDAEVLAPPSLRKLAAEQLEAALTKYS